MADLKRPKRIAMYQDKHEYPNLHIMVTSNTRYWEGRMTLRDIDEAMEKIELWLRKAIK